MKNSLKINVSGKNINGKIIIILSIIFFAVGLIFFFSDVNPKISLVRKDITNDRLKK